MKVYEPKSVEDFKKYFDLRWRILRKPWGQPRGTEKDELEERSIHLMVCESGRIPIGIGRAHFNSPDEAQIRFMAVAEQFQGKGVGRLVLKELEKRVKAKGAKQITMNARKTAADFYEKHGYKVMGKAHVLFDSVLHLRMRKEL